MALDNFDSDSVEKYLNEIILKTHDEIDNHHENAIMFARIRADKWGGEKEEKFKVPLTEKERLVLNEATHQALHLWGGEIDHKRFTSEEDVQQFMDNLVEDIHGGLIKLQDSSNINEDRFRNCINVFLIYCETGEYNEEHDIIQFIALLIVSSSDKLSRMQMP